MHYRATTTSSGMRLSDAGEKDAAKISLANSAHGRKIVMHRGIQEARKATISSGMRLSDAGKKDPAKISLADSAHDRKINMLAPRYPGGSQSDNLSLVDIKSAYIWSPEYEQYYLVEKDGSGQLKYIWTKPKTAPSPLNGCSRPYTYDSGRYR